MGSEIFLLESHPSFCGLHMLQSFQNMSFPHFIRFVLSFVSGWLVGFYWSSGEMKSQVDGSEDQRNTKHEIPYHRVDEIIKVYC